MTKPKVDTSSSGVGSKVSGDIKTIQINNKLNNNAIEAQLDDVHADKFDLKTLKPKPAMVAPTTTTSAAPMGLAKPQQIIDVKATQKPISVANASQDIANKSNNNVTNSVTAAKNPAKESTKKKSKEKDQKAAEEKRRQQEEEEERKRLELIAAQRKAKLVDQNAVRAEQGPKRNNLAASVGKCLCITTIHSESSALNATN